MWLGRQDSNLRMPDQSPASYRLATPMPGASLRRAGALAVLGGFGASLAWDTPAGPSIVVATTTLSVLSLAGTALRSRAWGESA
jgi:ABC-type Mn2+/Zn2+ transport system permease subunit